MTAHLNTASKFIVTNYQQHHIKKKTDTNAKQSKENEINAINC